MIYRILADVTLALHLAFILFVVLGGLLVLWRPWIAWVHVPAAIWGALIVLIGWICPLTPMENYFRRLGGEAGYTDGFIEHYLVALIYPGGLSRTGFVVLSIGAVAVNVGIYGWIYRTARRSV
ncbi:MAG TPA: DUF2784 domain-containing protein [Longimicrobiales bacterium]|nr:DUF2784 domain-containing protein [Longimicrobiales bacterium]